MQTRHYGVWPNGLPHSLPPFEGSVFDNLRISARSNPDAIAISYYGKTLTYAKLLDEVLCLAGFLQSKTASSENDRIALYLQNSPQFVIAYYAILAAGMVVVPVNPMSRHKELAHILSDCSARGLIFGSDLEPEVSALGQEFDHLTLISATYSDYIDPETDLRVPALVKDAKHSSLGTPWSDALTVTGLAAPPDRRPEDWCLIPYSSGTTGAPKGCLHTHASVNATIHAYPDWVDIAQGSKVLASLPFCHVTGMQHSMNVPIATASTIFLMTRWNAETAATLIERERIEHWRSITTMMIDFLSLPEIESRDLSSLKAIGGGGAQMPKSIARKMRDAIGLNYIEAYGLTETMAPTHINPPQAPKPQCLGIPIFGVDSRVLDTISGLELGPGETGEIITHAPQVFQGYWNNKTATDAVFVEHDGKKFLRTGDIGFYDEDGYFFFVDRLKRMINVSGMKVWPAEVEAVLHGHPDIAEACIVGDPDDRTGEAIRAVIVPANSAAILDEEELISWCRTQMAAYKIPKRFEFRLELPRSAAGKVQWKELALNLPVAR